MTLLAQVTQLAQPAADASESQVSAMLMNSTALLAELEPTIAAEAMLAVQMIGAQAVVMTFLQNATLVSEGGMADRLGSVAAP